MRGGGKRKRWGGLKKGGEAEPVSSDWEIETPVLSVRALASGDVPVPGIVGKRRRDGALRSGKVSGAMFTRSQMPEDGDSSVWPHVIRSTGCRSLEVIDAEDKHVILRLRYPDLHPATTRNVGRLARKFLGNQNPVREKDCHAGLMVAAGRQCLHGCERSNYSLVPGGGECLEKRRKDMVAEVGNCGESMWSLFKTWPEFDGISHHAACSYKGRPRTFSASRDLTNCPHCDLLVCFNRVSPLCPLHRLPRVHRPASSRITPHPLHRLPRCIVPHHAASPCLWCIKI